MIDNNDLKVVKTKDSHGAKKFTVGVKITASCLQDIYSEAPVPMIEDRLKREVWNAVYEDLQRPLFRLKSEVLEKLMPYEREDIEKQFNYLIRLITFH